VTTTLVIGRRLLDGSGIVVYDARDGGDGRGAAEDDGGGRRRGDGDDWRTAC
jgi:hypothetical protein